METGLGMIQKRAVQALDQAGARRLFFAKASSLRVFSQALIGGWLLVGVFIHPWVVYWCGSACKVASLWLPVR